MVAQICAAFSQQGNWLTGHGNRAKRIESAVNTIPISTLLMAIAAMEKAQQQMLSKGLFKESLELSNPIGHLQFYVNTVLAAVPKLEVTT